VNKIKLLNFFCSSTSRIPHLEVTAQDETSLCVFYFTTIEVREASFVKCYGRCYIKLRPGAGNLSIPPGINFRGSSSAESESSASALSDSCADELPSRGGPSSCTSLSRFPRAVSPGECCAWSDDGEADVSRGAIANLGGGKGIMSSSWELDCDSAIRNI
jgi:hypothetical protein